MGYGIFLPGESSSAFSLPAHQPPAPLAICDKTPMNMPATMPMPALSDPPVDPTVLKKVDEALVWWQNARKAARSVLEGTTSNSSTASLRQQMHGKLGEMFNLQVQLEKIRMFQTGNASEIKNNLNAFVKDLVLIQDMIKGIQAMT